MWLLWLYGCFHFFFGVLGRNLSWALAMLGNGGMGCVMHVCSIHSLRELIISRNLVWASSHWAGVRWSCNSVCVRPSIGRLCLSRNIVIRAWRLSEGMGYMIRGLCVGVVVSLMTMLLVLVVIVPGSGLSFG